ncbi:MAG: hypothetical protein AAGF33_09350 [Pseudomonadota bacterium]
MTDQQPDHGVARLAKRKERNRRMPWQPIVAASAVTLSMGASGFAQPIAEPSCEYGTVHKNAPAEIDQFGFMIGNYTVSMHRWLGEDWSPAMPGTSARWNGYYGLGGMAIVDEWYNPDPAQDPDAFRGINVRMYDTDAAEWDMMWLDTGGKQVADLRAKMIDGVLTMWQITPERPGFRAEFYVEDEDNWSRITYSRNEEDADWQPTFKLNATRIGCNADEAS